MNQEIVAFLGLAIIACFLVIFLRQYKPEYALLVALLASTFLLVWILDDMIRIIGEIRSLFTKANIPTEYLAVVFKALGICYLTQFATDLCKDFGQNALAGKVELIGKIAVFLLSLPVMQQVVDFSVQLIQG